MSAPAASPRRADAAGVRPDRVVAVDPEAVFRATRAELLIYFERRLGSPELAADFAQDAMLRFVKAGYEAPLDEARALVFAIARNLFLDHMRKRRRERALGFEDLLEASALERVACEDAPADEAVAAKRQLEATWAAIEKLPRRCRRVFVLHRLHGRTHQDIALSLGISRSMVEKHVMEATARLARAVKRDTQKT